MWQLSTLTQQVTTNKEYSELTNARDYLIYHIVNQKRGINKRASDCHSNTLCPYKNITVIDMEITIATSYHNITEMHR